MTKGRSMSDGPQRTLSLAQVPPEAMEPDELVTEVRRLRLRLDALREQRDERIAQLQEQEQAVAAAQAAEQAALQRAEAAEKALEAVLSTRSMRMLRVPRAAYGRLRALRS